MQVETEDLCLDMCREVSAILACGEVDCAKMRRIDDVVSEKSRAMQVRNHISNVALAQQLYGCCTLNLF